MKKIQSLAIAVAMITSSNAATIVAGDVTSTLGPNFFIDGASTGGGDTNATSTVAFNRNLGTLNVGTEGTTVSLTGFGFASAGSQILSTSFSMTVTYLGLNGALGGGDDVVFGTVTNSVTGSAAGTEYVWAFDAPLTKDIDGLNSLFRFDLSATGGTFRFKTTSGTDISAAKFSVAGTSVAIPEPSTALLGAIGALALLRRSR